MIATPIGMFKPAVTAGPSLVGIWGWWMGSEAYTETSGTPTTKQTTNGGAVGSLKDMSGNGRHLYQATAAAKPSYQTGIINSLPSWRHASGDYMNTSSGQVVSSSSPANCSFYCVLKRSGWESNGGLFATDVDASIFMVWCSGSTGNYKPRYGGTDSGPEINIANATNTLFAYSGALSSTGYSKLNNAANVTNAMPSSTGGGGNVMRMGRFAGNGYYIGDILEFIFYHGTGAYHGDPTSGEGLKTRQYLNTKYALGLGI